MVDESYGIIEYGWLDEGGRCFLAAASDHDSPFWCEDVDVVCLDPVAAEDEVGHQVRCDVGHDC